MTDLLKDEVDFEKWHYKNDFTHVFFYHEHTFKAIERSFGFEMIEISGRLVTLKRPDVNLTEKNEYLLGWRTSLRTFL